MRQPERSYKSRVEQRAGSSPRERVPTASSTCSLQVGGVGFERGVGFPVCVESRVFILYVVQKPDDDLDTSPKMAASPIRERESFEAAGT